MEKRNREALISRFSCVANRLENGQITSHTRYVGMEAAAQAAVSHLMTAMFPLHLGNSAEGISEHEKRTEELSLAYDALIRALGYVYETEEKASETALALIELLPDILAELKTDLIAAYQGDPAAVSIDEVVLTYPAFKAIGIYRIAHRLYQMQVPLLPRMLTEYSHSLTGIDIHPGASIGRYFFIDHGTGVVIGETTTIGEHVKLYQNVTLGAKSFEVGEDGSLVKGTKRHPDIGDHVVIYAGATILGGETVVGDHCVIGGNVWLDYSLEPNKTITILASDKCRCRDNRACPVREAEQ